VQFFGLIPKTREAVALLRWLTVEGWQPVWIRTLPIAAAWFFTPIAFSNSQDGISCAGWILELGGMKVSADSGVAIGTSTGAGMAAAKRGSSVESSFTARMPLGPDRSHGETGSL